MPCRIGLAFALAVNLLAVPGTSLIAAERPNIVLVLADDK